MNIGGNYGGQGSLSTSAFVFSYSRSNSSAMALYFLLRKSRRAHSFLFSSFVLCLPLFALRASRSTYDNLFFIFWKTCPDLPERKFIVLKIIFC